MYLLPSRQVGVEFGREMVKKSSAEVNSYRRTLESLQMLIQCRSEVSGLLPSVASSWKALGSVGSAGIVREVSELAGWRQAIARERRYRRKQDLSRA